MRRLHIIATTIILLSTVFFTIQAHAYAKNSVLRNGNWAKIQVSSTGIHRLTSDVIRRAGFNDLSKVRIYGYGGALVPERLTQDYINETDDLPEVPTYTENGVKYFYAQGPVSWSSNSTTTRTRNPYSDYGCYFITQSDKEGKTITAEELMNMQVGSAEVRHFLHEKDEFAWEQIGRNLVEKALITKGNSKTYEIVIPKGNTNAQFRIVLTTIASSAYTVKVGESFSSNGSMKLSSDYDKALFRVIQGSINSSDLNSAQVDSKGNYLVPVVISCTGDDPLRLDYIAASFSEIEEQPVIGSDYPAAEYVYNIMNQNHHADDPVDLLIIIPTSQNTLAQAEELAELHRVHDGMTVRIVPADELYNEFSSGTPDVSAYKRYLKMFYDKDTTALRKETIRMCLLFGDCVWDNRMKTLSKTNYNPDNYLLCYQTENSYNLINSVTSDDFIGIMQDDKTIHADGIIDRSMQIDVATGRFPVSTSAQAQVMVSKVSHYMNTIPGSWANIMMFIGDDGDNNSHMRNINVNADAVAVRSPGYTIKKVMFDAYEKTSTSTGDKYPDVEEIVKKQQSQGCLVMNYGGHGTFTELGHEKILNLRDFGKFRGENLPLWFTAACETMPFAMTEETIGEYAVLNPDGGAIAFIGTVGTVLEEPNSRLDKYFMKYVLSYDDNGDPMTIGEALRMAKNALIAGSDPSIGSDNTINKHHYHLLGDPAMKLALPTYEMIIDSIDGNSALADNNEEEMAVIKGGSIVKVRGHVENRNGEDATYFNGTATITVKDSRQLITCRDQADANTVFQFYDYDSNLFVGTCSVVDGEFSITFRVPQEIYNDGGQGLITMHAVDKNHGITANGETTRFKATGWTDVVDDGVGPSIFAYLNNPTFQNGGEVGYTPFFVAEVTDKDGVNVTGAAIGHNLELIIDGSADMTYDLNDNFVFDSDSYEKGQTYMVLPSLEVGVHTLAFRAWDILGNNNQVELSFRVVKGMRPSIDRIFVSPNPVRGTATFYVTHDMPGTEATVYIDIIDMSGRIVQTLQWDDIFSETNSTSTYKWTASGMNRGMYLYRVRLSADGSDFVSKTEKLIIAD